MASGDTNTEKKNGKMPIDYSYGLTRRILLSGNPDMVYKNLYTPGSTHLAIFQMDTK